MFGKKESKDEQRQVYLETIRDIDTTRLVYLDETGIDDNEVYPYAWGPIGKRIHALKNAFKNKRLSIIGALSGSTIIAAFVFEGYCDRKVFETFIEKVLIPKLRPGQIVIMDNASFHKGGKIKFLIESVGCKVLYLSPYSPDLNPIEHYWAAIKHRMRQYLLLFERCLYKAAEYAFQNAPT